MSLYSSGTFPAQEEAPTRLRGSEPPRDVW